MRDELDDAGKRQYDDRHHVPRSSTFESDGSVECEANEGGASNWHLIPPGERYEVTDRGEVHCLECTGRVPVEG